MSVIAVAKSLESRDTQVARESRYVALVGLLFFIAGLWQQPFIGFESRFALFAQEMLRHGPTLFPTTYGQPYPDYPVTGTLLIWLCSLPFGAVTKFSAVLPTAIAAALNCMLLYRLLALHSRRWAVMALCMQLLTVTYLAEARSISLDQMVATVTLFGFYLMHVGSISASSYASLPRLLPLVLLAGFAVRGPLGVVIPAGAMCAYCVAMRNWSGLWRLGILTVTVLVLAWGALLLLSAQLYGASFVSDVLNMQVFGRLDAQQGLGYFYYFVSSSGNYALTYPLATIVMAALAIHAFKKRTVKVGSAETQILLLGFILWVVVVMIGLSIPHVKKARYILPIVPALSALAAYPWLEAPTRILKWVKIAIENFFAGLPLLLMAAIAVMAHRVKHYHGGVHLSLPLIYSALAAAQVAVVGVYVKSSTSSRALALAIIAAVSMWSVTVIVVEPAQRQLHDTANFVAQVEVLRAHKHGALALYGMAKDGEAIKYLVNVAYDLKPLFINDARDIARFSDPVYVMINDRDINAAQYGAGVSNKLTAASRVLTGYFDGHAFSVFYLSRRQR